MLIACPLARRRFPRLSPSRATAAMLYSYRVHESGLILGLFKKCLNCWFGAFI